MKTLKIWLIVILSPIAACALIWAAIQSFQGDSREEERARIEEERRWRLDPTKTPEYQRKLDESLREIQQMKDEQNFDPLNPDYGPPKKNPLPDAALPGTMRPTTASTDTQFGQTTPEQRQKYEAIIAERLGIGAPDPTPPTESELKRALEEIQTLQTQMTLPAVEDPGPDRPPHTAHDDTFTLWQQMRTLKDAGKISELAFRAIRNEHVIITYQPMVYGKPRVVKSIKAGQDKPDPETSEPAQASPQ